MGYSLAELEELYQLPLWELLSEANRIQQQYRRCPQIQLCYLINVRQGGCPEDCAYCAQSAHYPSGRKASALMKPAELLACAQQAKEKGVHRLCLGAAWRGLKEDDPKLAEICQLVETLRPLELEVCTTLGLLAKGAAQKLRESGVGFYNHNLNTGPRFYPRIASTHSFQDRVRTLEVAQEAGLALCSGGIIGMGESWRDRLELLATLSSLPGAPESIPWNLLVPIPGTPLEELRAPVPLWDVVRILAVTRIAFPKARVRLSAGRRELSQEAQALCFLAGADSIFFGEKLLTVPNQPEKDDRNLLQELGLWDATDRFGSRLFASPEPASSAVAQTRFSRKK
ncbi:biotin synthase BioB [Candidatus Methylacidithermus pantelleriae]|uniref:Biotin synthase n=1 Tax=Candidatus Methylacidithermus pantelleriae TaxID=2744239 RepID=A0A8J2BRQ9_9BACT|nr:biotin synthase BioB [Candidatus Methylacidithermus pantelleriae]CAF0694643.1 Biotin synthase [Candidatus Methylacidithermus pantelleriae]